MIKIKVCGMTDPVNTEAIAVLPVDYMGFLFYPGSERYVGGSPGTALFDWDCLDERGQLVTIVRLCSTVS